MAEETDIEDYAEFLVRSKKSDTAIVHEFSLAYNEQEEQLHIFLEGDEDKLYYLPIIRRLHSDRILHVYVCDGKRGVVTARNDVYSGEYNKNLCLFFVDRDFDDYLGVQINLDDHTFVTKYYSIENYLVTPESLEVILTDFVGLPKNSNEYRKICASFDKGYNIFSRKLRGFLALTLGHREAEVKVNLNNIDLKKIVVVLEDGGLGKKKKSFETFLKNCGIENAERASFSRLKAWCCKLNDDPVKVWLRGKFELWYFVQFLRVELRRLVRANVEVNGKRIRTPAIVSTGQYFEALGGRIKVPVELDEFLVNAKALINN